MKAGESPVKKPVRVGSTMHLIFLLQIGPLIVRLMHTDYDSRRQVRWLAAVETIAEFLCVCLDSCTHDV